MAIYSDGTNLTHVAGDIYRMSSVSGGSQTWLVQGWGPYSTPTADPLSNFQYLYAGEAEVGTPPYTGAIGGSSYSNITYTGKGNFTHFFMSWNNDSPKLQISMVNIIRFAA